MNRSMKVLNFEVLALILESVDQKYLHNLCRARVRLFLMALICFTTRVAKTKDVLTVCRKNLEEDLVRKLNSLKLDNTQTKTELFFSCLDHTLICYPSVLKK